MDRFSKVVIALWACAAVAWQATRLLSWPHLPLITAVVAIAACVLTRIDRRAIGLVLVTAYSFNAIVRLVQGLPYPPFAVLWLAALLGAILPGVLTTGWHLPRLWRGALVFVALVTIVGAPIIVWREVDGALPIAFGIDIHWLGGAPPFIVSWVLHVSIMAVVGILWFDWLLGEPNLDVERTIITPLIVGVVVMSAVSAYQTFVDIHFFNETVYQNLGRATGTMWDANLAGMLAALWLGGTIVWADRVRGWTLYFAPFAVVLTAIAAWASGSRSALGVMLTVACGVMIAFAVSAGRLHTRRLTLASVAAGVLIAAVVVFGMATRNSANPAGRLMSSLITYATYGGVASELWNRNGYGTAATLLIRRYPISGVGIGCFPTIVGRSPGTGRPPAAGQRAELAASTDRRVGRYWRNRLGGVVFRVCRLRVRATKVGTCQHLDRPGHPRRVRICVTPGYAGAGSVCRDHVLDDRLLVCQPCGEAGHG